MKRNLFWGAIALIPLPLLVYVFIGGNQDQSFVPFNLNYEYWGMNWWRDIAFFVVLSWLVFIIDAILSKRFIWLAILILISVPAQPFYWWLNSGKNT